MPNKGLRWRDQSFSGGIPQRNVNTSEKKACCELFQLEGTPTRRGRLHTQILGDTESGNVCPPRSRRRLVCTWPKNSCNSSFVLICTWLSHALQAASYISKVFACHGEENMAMPSVSRHVPSGPPLASQRRQGFVWWAHVGKPRMSPRTQPSPL